MSSGAGAVGIGRSLPLSAAFPASDPQVRMAQAVEVVLIQAGVFILQGWALLGRAGGGHLVWLTLAVSHRLPLSLVSHKCVCVSKSLITGSNL